MHEREVLPQRKPVFPASFRIRIRGVVVVGCRCADCGLICVVPVIGPRRGAGGALALGARVGARECLVRSIVIGERTGNYFCNLGTAEKERLHAVTWCAITLPLTLGRLPSNLLF